MDSEQGFDPRMDEEYQLYLIQKEQRAAQEAYAASRPGGKAVSEIVREQYRKTYDNPKSRPYMGETREPGTAASPVRTFDKSQEQGRTFARIQKHYADKKRGVEVYNGQTRVAIQEYKGNQYVSLENWKVAEGDEQHTPDRQKHEWKGACNVSLVNLRELASILSALADSLDGGVVR